MPPVTFESRPRRANDSALDIMQAQQFARPFIGEVDLSNVGSAADIYRLVLASCGVDTADLPDEILPRFLPLLKPAGNANGGKMETAEDAAIRKPDAGFYDRWPECKPGYKAPAR